MELICSICGAAYLELPSDAVPIGRRRTNGYQMYLIGGIAHDLGNNHQRKLNGLKTAHTQYHKNKFVNDCIYCQSEVEHAALPQEKV